MGCLKKQRRTWLGLALGLATLAAFATQEPPSAYTLLQLEVQGTTRFSSEEVARAAGLSLDQPVTIGELEEAVRRLSRLGVFAEVGFQYHAQGESLKVTVQVKERPAPLRCIYANFIWFEDEELLEYLKQAVPLFDGTVPLSGSQTEVVQEALGKLLRERNLPGFVRSHARVDTSSRQANYTGVVFEIQGIYFPVERFTMNGLKKVSERDLRNETDRLLREGYDKVLLDDFIRRELPRVFHRYGLLTATVELSPPKVAQVDEVTYSVELSFNVTEGPSFTVRTLEVEGAGQVSADRVRKDLPLRPGKPANLVGLQTDLEKIRSERYLSEGYLDAELKFRAELDRASTEADIRVLVSEGVQYLFESVEFAGLPLQVKEQLGKKWNIKRGDIYRAEDVRKFLEKDAARILSSARLRFTRFDVETQKNPDAHTVSLRIRFL